MFPLIPISSHSSHCATHPFPHHPMGLWVEYETTDTAESGKSGESCYRFSIYLPASAMVTPPEIIQRFSLCGFPRSGRSMTYLMSVLHVQGFELLCPMFDGATARPLRKDAHI